MPDMWPTFRRGRTVTDFYFIEETIAPVSQLLKKKKEIISSTLLIEHETTAIRDRRRFARIGLALTINRVSIVILFFYPGRQIWYQPLFFLNFDTVPKK